MSAIWSKLKSDRTVQTRAILGLAVFLGMLASFPLWLNSRSFPLLRIAPWFPVLPSPWDKIRLATMLVALVLSCWRYRPAISFFLVASLLAYFEDQNRGQPWFYMYWVMLLLTLFPEATALAACRVAMSAAYFWSGIQKFNPNFFHGTPGWFIAPAAHWGLPSFVLDLMRLAVTTAPFLELAIGLGLWVPRLRWPCIGAVFIVHLAALLFLGPLGHNYNWVVWPWNLAMAGLVWVLFAGKSTPRVRENVTEISQTYLSLAVVGAYTFLPALSFFGYWDSDFSFTLYSENQANANIFVTPAFVERLPPELRHYTKPLPQGYDPQFQGPNAFMFGTWCYEELHVPLVPEPRNFYAVFCFLRAYSQRPEEVRLIVDTRGGPICFYEGDRKVLLPRKQ